MIGEVYVILNETSNLKSSSFQFVIFMPPSLANHRIPCPSIWQGTIWVSSALFCCCSLEWVLHPGHRVDRDFVQHIRVFPNIGVPQNGWFTMDNPTKMHDLGVPLFLETPIYKHIYFCAAFFVRGRNKTKMSDLEIFQLYPQSFWNDRLRMSFIFCWSVGVVGGLESQWKIWKFQSMTWHCSKNDGSQTWVPHQDEETSLPSYFVHWTMVIGCYTMRYHVFN